MRGHVIKAGISTCIKPGIGAVLILLEDTFCATIFFPSFVSVLA